MPRETGGKVERGESNTGGEREIEIGDNGGEEEKRQKEEED